MDEWIFRIEQATEALQIQIKIVLEASLRIAQKFLDDGRTLASRSFSETTLQMVRYRAENVWNVILQALEQLKELCLRLSKLVNPKLIFENCLKFLKNRIFVNNVIGLCIGFGVGTIGGLFFGLWLTKQNLSAPVMKSIGCLSMEESDNVTLCHTAIPTLIRPTDILVRVKAVSLNRLDERITHGYGHRLRPMITTKSSSNDCNEFPLIIGRACAGIVEGVGAASKSGLEIGDEVWLATPWYERGLACEIIVAPEYRIGRKPFIIGFEGAASLPYSGCAALAALKTAGLNEHNCVGRRVLIQDGCSPVGCVLTQLTRKWGAFVTATCHARSAPVVRALGADDVIAFYSQREIEDDEPLFEEQNILFKELSIRKEYNYVFLTTQTHYDKKFIRMFVSPNGVIVDTIEFQQPSDDYGVFKMFFYSFYVKLKLISGRFFSFTPDWGGPHLCHLALDRLANYVNENVLQTVVDQVYTPQDAENALAHVCNPKAIGSTIITFR